MLSQRYPLVIVSSTSKAGQKWASGLIVKNDPVHTSEVYGGILPIMLFYSDRREFSADRIH